MEAVREYDVALVKADWTKRDARIAKALAAFGRTSVPLYVVYSPDPAREPVVLPIVITEGIVVDAIRDAVR